MLLIFTAIDPDHQFRTFSCWSNSLEESIDIVNYLVSKGSKIISIDLFDSDQCIHLPTQAFDGVPCLDAIQQMELDWKEALNMQVDKPKQ